MLKEVREMSDVSQSEYKGSPMLVLKQSSQDQFPFQFGLRKAKLVLAHMDDIRRFVKQHDAE